MLTSQSLLPAIGLAQTSACYSPPVTITTLPAAGGRSSFLIYKQPGCAWFLPPAGNVVSHAGWITLPTNIWWGYGNAGVFGFDVAANTGPARTGTITAVGFTFTVRQTGASDPIPITGAAAPGLSAMDSLMTRDMLEFGAPGGALAITYKGRLVYARGFGYSDLASLELVQPDSLFRLASVSKLMTMAAITNLIQKNSFTPASKVFSSILTNFVPPPGLSVVDPRWYDITVDELVNHTGGFLRTKVDRALDFNFLKAATSALGQTMPGDNTSVIRYAMSQPLDFTPGAPPNPCPDCYSNFGYQILGRVVEKATGGSYEDYIRNTLMAPAGVVRTRLGRSFADQAAPGEVKYYASGSEMWGDSVFAALPGPTLSTYGTFPYENMDSFGAMISNTMDLLRFYLRWLNWGPGSGFYGSLPGTNTAVFTLASNNDVKYAFLFNYRSDHNRTNTAACTAANPCDLQVAVQNDVEATLRGITNWPAGDLFPQYSGPNPACPFSVGPAAFTVDGGSHVASVSVASTGSPCSWVAVSDVPWITAATPSGTDSGTENFTIVANTSGIARSATVYVAGRPVTITQNLTAPGKETLTLNVAPAGAGTVTAKPASPDGSYPDGTQVCFSISPTPTWAFEGWSGAPVDSNNCVVIHANVTITATFTQGPVISADLKVENAASNIKAQGVAPGSFVAIYGANFASAVTSAASLPLPTKLADVTVTFNGIQAPLVAVGHFANYDQINAQMPWEIQPGTAQVVVTRAGVSSPAVTIPIIAAAPGLLYIATDGTGVNRPLVYNNSDNTFSYPAGAFGQNLRTRPAKIGEILILLCTGLGAVTVTPPDGAPALQNGRYVESDTLTRPVVLVGGVQATVGFSGLSQYPSLYQLNFTLAPGTPTGNAVPIQIQMNGITTTDQLMIAVTN